MSYDTKTKILGILNDTDNYTIEQYKELIAGILELSGNYHKQIKDKIKKMRDENGN